MPKKTQLMQFHSPEKTYKSVNATKWIMLVGVLIILINLAYNIYIHYKINATHTKIYASDYDGTTHVFKQLSNNERTDIQLISFTRQYLDNLFGYDYRELDEFRRMGSKIDPRYNRLVSALSLSTREVRETVESALFTAKEQNTLAIDIMIKNRFQVYSFGTIDSLYYNDRILPIIRADDRNKAISNIEVNIKQKSPPEYEVEFTLLRVNTLHPQQGNRYIPDKGGREIRKGSLILKTTIPTDNIILGEYGLIVTFINI